MPSDKQISQLPAASAVQTSDYIAIEQGGEAKKASGEIFRAFAVGAVAPLVTQAQEAATSAVSAKNAAEAARDIAVSSKEAAQTAATTAVSAKDDAVAANTAAQSAKDTAVSSKEAAQTAATTAVSAKEDAEAAADLAEEAWENIETKANIDGTYDGLTSGYAKDILSTKGDSDDSTYLIRKSGGDVDIYETEVVKEIEGASISWNQLIENGDFSDGTTGWSKNSTATMSVIDNVLNLSMASSTTSNRIWGKLSPTTISGHKYFLSADLWAGSAVGGFIVLNATGAASGNIDDITTTRKTYSHIVSSPADDGYITIGSRSSLSSDTILYIANVNAIDLTLMLGPAVADAIYAMETATAGSGVAFLKENFPGLFTSYHPYNAGEIISVKSSGRKVTGINQWDEEWELGAIDPATGIPYNQSTTIRSKNFIPVLPNTRYYMVSPSNTGGTVLAYGKDQSFIGTLAINTTAIPSNCYYLKFYKGTAYGTTYNNDICINISDPDINGKYFPYEEETYPHSDVPLRGLYRLTDGKLTAYGDKYQPNGKVKRRFGLVDLGTFNWSYLSSGQQFYVPIADMKTGVPTSAVLDFLCCSKYANSPRPGIANVTNMHIGTGSGGGNSNNNIVIMDSNYSDVATFKAAMSGIYLLYELATETEEITTPYQQTQKIFSGGTESFIDERDIALPVGINSFFPISTVSKLDALPFATGTDGLYILEEEDKSLSLKSFDEAVELAIEKGIVSRPIEEDISNVPIASFPDGAENVNVKELIVDIPVKQNLNGYDHPWPAGGEKNKYAPKGVGRYQSNVQSITYSDTVTVSGFTATLNGEIIKLNGTATATTPMIAVKPMTLPAGTYDVTVSTNLTEQENISIYVGYGNTETLLSRITTASETLYYKTITLSSDIDVYFAIAYNIESSAANKTLKFQIETNSASTPTNWSPYENICPILPVTEVEVSRTGKNLFDGTLESVGTYLDVSGNEVSNTSWGLSKYIKASGTITLSVSADILGNAPSICWYDKERSFIGGETYGGVASKTVTLPTNAVYVRLSIRRAAIGTYQLEIGSTATTYSPYAGQQSLINIGINQWDEEWELGTLDATTGAEVASTTTIRSKNYIPIIGGASYSANTANASATAFYICYYNSAKTFISSATPAKGTAFTVPANASYMRFRMQSQYGTTYHNNISINYPSRFTAYYPYTGNVVYGGELDVTTGVLTSTYKFKHLTGAETTSITGQVRTPYNGWAFSVTGYGIACKAGAEAYSSINKPTFYSSAKVTGFCKALSVAPIFFLLDSDSGLDSTATLAQIRDAYIAYITETKPMIAYEITNPVTIQLTPAEVKTLLRNNIIYSDSGDILKLTYRADIKAYIEKVIA